MVLKDLPDDEMACWALAWDLAERMLVEYPPVLSAVLIRDGVDNLRMQSFVYEWAVLGYAPAQRAWARRIAARL